MLSVLTILSNPALSSASPTRNLSSPAAEAFNEKVTIFLADTETLLKDTDILLPILQGLNQEDYSNYIQTALRKLNEFHIQLSNLSDLANNNVFIGFQDPRVTENSDLFQEYHESIQNLLSISKDLNNVHDDLKNQYDSSPGMDDSIKFYAYHYFDSFHSNISFKANSVKDKLNNYSFHVSMEDPDLQNDLISLADASYALQQEIKTVLHKFYTFSEACEALNNKLNRIQNDIETAIQQLDQIKDKVRLLNLGFIEEPLERINFNFLGDINYWKFRVITKIEDLTYGLLRITPIEYEIVNPFITQKATAEGEDQGHQKFSFPNKLVREEEIENLYADIHMRSHTVKAACMYQIYKRKKEKIESGMRSEKIVDRSF
jgi:hypothetical protein